MIQLFKRLHASEINFSITTFWDSDLTFKLGDELNGFSDQFETDDFEKGLNWLENQAKIVYPDSKFAKENYKPSFEESARPLMKYLGHNHHPHTSVYVRNDVAELLEGKETIVTKDYILD